MKETQSQKESVISVQESTGTHISCGRLVLPVPEATSCQYWSTVGNRLQMAAILPDEQPPACDDWENNNLCATKSCETLSIKNEIWLAKSKLKAELFWRNKMYAHVTPFLVVGWIQVCEYLLINHTDLVYLVKFTWARLQTIQYCISTYC